MKYRCPVCGTKCEMSFSHCGFKPSPVTEIFDPPSKTDQFVVSRFNELLRGGKIEFINDCAGSVHVNPVDFEKRIKAGNHDSQVVERFNELVKEGNVEYRCGDAVSFGKVYEKGIYRLRPTPRYRAFTAVEAAGHLGNHVTADKPKIKDYPFIVSCDGIYVDGLKFTFSYACEHMVFADTGEPFGIRVSE